ncbi:hypothetical protein CSPX01_02509 [Colletotrichum filicis]|nr:hypothetical protein CSPX01_02509 [Colletotrichum filicis]
MQFQRGLVHFLIPFVLLFGALTYFSGFLLLWSLVAHGSRSLALGAQEPFSHARWSATVIHLPLDGIWADDRTYSVVKQNYELYECKYHEPALGLICVLIRSMAARMENLYNFSLLQNLFTVLGNYVGAILATLAIYLGLPSSLGRENRTKPNTKIQKQESRGRAKANGAAKSQGKGKGKGRSVGTRKTPTDGPEDGEDSGDDSDDSGKEEGPRGRRPTGLPMGCPFYKLDPITHYRCVAKYRIIGFNRLKQHLERCHSLGEFYCPLCYKKFKKNPAAARDDHVRLGNCQVRAYTDDFMGDEILQLQGDVPWGSNDEEKYFWVWDNFFKEHPRPKSAYVFEGIWEPLSILAGTAERNINTEDFSSWAREFLLATWEDVLPRLLTLRNERTQISRRIPLHSMNEHGRDPSIRVMDDTHLTVLQPNPSNSNGTTYITPFLPNVPTTGLDVDMLNGDITSGLCNPGHPESSVPGNATSLSTEGIADNIAPYEISTSGIPHPMDMEDFVDLDGETEEKGSQEQRQARR